MGVTADDVFFHELAAVVYLSAWYWLVSDIESVDGLAVPSVMGTNQRTAKNTGFSFPVWTSDEEQMEVVLPHGIFLCQFELWL